MAEEHNIPKVYDPASVEKKWYKYWEEHRYFHAEVEADKKPFSIVIPPPNITGQLHMGHALDNTLQDILIRWHRMMGDNTLWMPGYDHAGLATQIKVEEVLKKEEGKTRYDLGREEFIKRVWEWKDKYGDRIIEQLKSLGVSCDWERKRFTMDEGCSQAVREVFVSLYEKGLIYQGSRITNWCVNCNTALSDIEVEHEDDAGNLWYVRYPVVGEMETYLTIATTRPETMLGDTAVAVNPEDPRYGHLVGKMLQLPLTERQIPIIADSYVDLEFGTGAVKITPAHDPNDFEVGNRHNLERIVVMNKDATMNENAGSYAGMDRFACREKLVKDLEEAGLLISIEPINHNVGFSERTDVMIEPYLSKQWFIKMRPLADAVLANQKNKDTKVNFVPERYEKIMNHWMEITYDWCISRQLWWGHRIPAWYKDDEVYVGMDAPEGEGWVQDPDVLDTWFSSALWPFSTLGWPDNTDLLKRYYPNNVLVTGYDIIPFWVNRMTFQGLEFLHKRPFKDCLIHGLIRDKQGRKMSKSLGNGIDPMDVIEEYGADSLRFFLTTSTASGMDLRYDEEKVKSTWNFINKVWNASRFVLMKLDGFKEEDYTLDNLKVEDKWILDKLNSTIKGVTKYMDKYDFNLAGSAIYEFAWSYFCDKYIELSKFYDDNTTKSVLLRVLTDIVKMLHPFMPYVTEEIYSMLPIKETESIMMSSYPEYDKNMVSATNIDTVLEFITMFRNKKADLGIGSDYKVYIKCNNDVDKQIIINMLKLNDKITDNSDNYTDKVEYNGIEIDIFFDNSKNVKEQEEKLLKEKESLEKSIERREKLLSNENYISKAPSSVVEKEREDLKKEKKLLNSLLNKFTK